MAEKCRYKIEGSIHVNYRNYYKKKDTFVATRATEKSE